MKTQTRFKNASLVSVVNGSIVVKDANGIEHTFTNASVVSINNGAIIINSEWEPQRGELVKVTGSCINAYCIIDRIAGDQIFVFGWKKIDYDSHWFKSEFWLKNSQTKISPVTLEEQKEFDNFCKSQGKIWNKETLQWEKYKWEPTRGEKFYYIDSTGEVGWTVYNTFVVDPRRIAYGNCFPNKEQAKRVAEKVKELLKSL